GRARLPCPLLARHSLERPRPSNPAIAIYWSKTVTLRLTSLFVGIACLGANLFLAHPPRQLHLIGWVALLIAYFLWLTQSYKVKAVLFTRGGPLDFYKQPLLYRSVYV